MLLAVGSATLGPPCGRDRYSCGLVKIMGVVTIIVVVVSSVGFCAITSTSVCVFIMCFMVYRWGFRLVAAAMRKIFDLNGPLMSVM